MRVLIIEQEKTFLQSLRNFFEQQKNFEVSCAHSGKEGYFLWHSNPFDLVLCSERLPDADGLETLKKMAREKPGAVSILMTAIHDDRLRQEAYRAGIRGYLEKPFNLQQLEEAVGL
jgi:two-component system response regulator CpxR